MAKAGYKEKEDFIVTRQYGLEKIEMIEGGGLASFRTRTSKGGLGEGYDLLIIDEAQEYQNDQETTLKYVVFFISESTDGILRNTAYNGILWHSIYAYEGEYIGG